MYAFRLRAAIYSQLFAGNLFIGDRSRLDFIAVRRDQAGDQRLAKPKAGINGYHFPVSGNRICSEHDSRSLRRNHPLDDDGQMNLSMVKAILYPVDYRTVCKERPSIC